MSSTDTSSYMFPPGRKQQESKMTEDSMFSATANAARPGSSSQSTVVAALSDYDDEVVISEVRRE